VIEKLAKDAKQEMHKWAEAQDYAVSQNEVNAWKDGYLAGFEKGTLIE
jgi:hypothetical protein